MDIEPNWLESFIKRPPSLITIAVLLLTGSGFYYSQKERLDIVDQRIQNYEVSITGLRGNIEVDAKGLVDLTTIVNLLGSRLDAQAARISGIDNELASMQNEIRQALRDQVATDKAILDKLGTLDASIAAMHADMNWITRLPIPPGTLSPRNSDPPNFLRGPR